MIAITFSLPDESRDFLRMLRVQERTGCGAGSSVRGTLAHHPAAPAQADALVIVWHIGVGRERAAKESARLLAEAKPDLVICAGYGGALIAGMQIGEIVVDARGTPLDSPLDARTGKIFTAASVAESVEEKQRLGQETGALAVDMETAVVAGVFEPAGIPVVGVRAISDRMEDAVPVPMDYWFDLQGQQPRIAALLGFLLRNPQRILPFARFVRGLGPARAALAGTLAEMVSHLARR